MQKKLRHTANVTVLTGLVLGILIFAQIISTKNFLRFDLTETKRYSLSEKSKKVLKLLNEPVKAIAFYGEKEFGRDKIEELFKEYKYSYPKFYYEFVDPVKNPAKAKKYKVQSHGTIILEYKGRREKVISREEEDITNANKIPQDASCLVIAGPQKNLFDTEFQAIKEYLDRGGKVLVMIDPYRCPSMEKFLANYNIELENDTIVDKTSKILGGEYLFPVVTKYESHPITRNLNYASFFPVARSLRLKRETSEIEVEVLARTGKDAWGETDREGLIEGKASFDEKKDIPGPLTIGAVSSFPVKEEKKKARIVVFGDSDFASNDYLEVSGNKDLILSTIGWLAEEESLISIRPREWGYTPLILSEKQSKILFWISVIILPLSVACVGIGVLAYRRWKG